MLDIRLPIGLMFAVIGPVLIVFGLVSDPKMYEVHSLSYNVNLWWGVVLLLFGAFMLSMAFRAGKRPRSSNAEESRPRRPE